MAVVLDCARSTAAPAHPPAAATVTDHIEGPLGELAGLAADLGPALAPTGHAELLQAATQAVRDLFAATACSLAPVDEDGERPEFVAAAGAELVVGTHPGRSGDRRVGARLRPADRAQRRRP